MEARNFTIEEKWLICGVLAGRLNEALLSEELQNRLVQETTSIRNNMSQDEFYRFGSAENYLLYLWEYEVYAAN